MTLADYTIKIEKHYSQKVGFYTPMDRKRQMMVSTGKFILFKLVLRQCPHK
jgi:hypothetical protein